MNLKQLQEHIVTEIREGKSLLGKDEWLTPLLKGAPKATLEGEMEDHLDQTRSNKNRRNGKSANNKNTKVFYASRGRVYKKMKLIQHFLIYRPMQPNKIKHYHAQTDA